MLHIFVGDVFTLIIETQNQHGNLLFRVRSYITYIASTLCRRHVSYGTITNIDGHSNFNFETDNDVVDRILSWDVVGP